MILHQVVAEATPLGHTQLPTCPGADFEKAAFSLLQAHFGIDFFLKKCFLEQDVLLNAITGVQRFTGQTHDLASPLLLPSYC